MNIVATENPVLHDVVGEKAGRVEQASKSEIRKTLGLLCDPDAVYELRVVKHRLGTIAGFYDDLDRMADDAYGLTEGGVYVPTRFKHEQVCDAGSVYLTLNPVKSVKVSLEGMGNRLRVVPARKNDDEAGWTAADDDVIRRRLILIDFDPWRCGLGIPTTDAGHRAGIQRAADVRGWLQERGWAGLLADSGNGGHDVFACDLPNDMESRDLIQSFLQGVAGRFGDKVEKDKTPHDESLIDIDTKVFNASRICTIWGTWKRKGDHRPDRPHRLAKIIDAPERLEPVPVELIRRAIDECRPSETVTVEMPGTSSTSASSTATTSSAGSTATSASSTSTSSSSTADAPSEGFGKVDLDNLGVERDDRLRLPVGFDLGAMLEAAGLSAGEPKPSGVFIHHPVTECPFDASHKRVKLSVHQSGTVTYMCPHKSCKGEKEGFVKRTARDYFNHYRLDIPTVDDGSKRPKGSKEPQQDTAELALRFVAEECPHLTFINRRAYTYSDGRYQHEDDIDSTVRKWLIGVGAPHNNLYVSNVVNDLKALKRDRRDLPFWRDGVERGEMIPFRNGLFNLDKFLDDGHVEVIPHTPDFVSDFRLDYDFDQAADCPRWLKFLDDVFESDPEKIDLLGEWFGYCLTAGQEHQKMLLKVGVTRSGKGTTDAVLQGFVGKEYCCGIDLHKLAGTYGCSKLIGKRVGLIGEVHLEKDSNKYVILERLKNIAGLDLIDIEQKYQDAVSMRLPVKLSISANDMPRFFDASGALSSRLLVLSFNRSFELNPDKTLAAKLLAELPGIARWALEGLRRLKRQGHFTEPSESRDIVRRVRREGSPAMAFLQDCCVVDRRINPGNLEGVTLGDDCDVLKQDLRDAITLWGHDIDNDTGPKHDLIFKDMISIIPRIQDGQRRVNGKRVRYFSGVTLNPEMADRVRAWVLAGRAVS